MATTLKGQIALVCGATGRVGSTIALTLARSGVGVGLQYCNSKDKADHLAAKIEAAGGTAVTINADLVKENSVTKMVQEIKTKFGNIHILVNAVHGQFDPKPVAEMVWRDWDVHIDGLKGHFLLCKAVLPVMREQHYGRIVYISAGLSRRYFKGCSAYTAVKAGLNGFCKTLALEEGENGITVNIVAPGKVVPLDDDRQSVDNPEAWEEMNRQSSAKTPLGREATSVDVAEAVLYFVSPQAGGITGQSLFVAGGEIMP